MIFRTQSNGLNDPFLDLDLYLRNSLDLAPQATAAPHPNKGETIKIITKQSSLIGLLHFLGIYLDIFTKLDQSISSFHKKKSSKVHAMVIAAAVCFSEDPTTSCTSIFGTVLTWRNSRRMACWQTATISGTSTNVGIKWWFILSNKYNKMTKKTGSKWLLL